MVNRRDLMALMGATALAGGAARAALRARGFAG